jgi:hypothetical protein
MFLGFGRTLRQFAFAHQNITTCYAGQPWSAVTGVPAASDFSIALALARFACTVFGYHLGFSPPRQCTAPGAAMHRAASDSKELSRANARLPPAGPSVY